MRTPTTDDMERAIGELLRQQKQGRFGKDRLLGPFECTLNFTIRLYGTMQEAVKTLEAALSQIDRSAWRRCFDRGLYGLDLLASTDVRLWCDLGTSVYSVARRYFLLLPHHNPSLAVLLAGQGPMLDPDRGSPQISLCELGAVPAGPPFYGHHDAPEVLAARDPATPGPQLAELAGTLSSVSALARRNPALPSAELRRYLAGGAWDAWCNPAAAFELLMAPSAALDDGAVSAALDAVRPPPWGLRGVPRDEVLPHLLACSGRDVAEEEVLAAIARLYRVSRTTARAGDIGPLRMVTGRWL